MKTLLSKVWEVGAGLKNLSYDYNVFEPVRLPIPVISVGNLSSGGTGKTPVVQGLTQYMSRRNKKVVIVSRNYRATIKTVGKVDLSVPNPALYFGDEPAWLAQSCPAATVYVGPKKAVTAKTAFEIEKPDVILVDDGYQHRALHRDLDLVLLDVSTPAEIKLLPAGLYREGIQSLKRADFAFLTKANWAESAQVQKWYSLAQNFAPLVEINFDLEIPELQTKNIAAFAGLAQPEKFHQILENRLGFPLQKFWSFKDHFDYPPMTLDEIARWMRENPTTILLTTEKDAVKIGPWMKLWPQVKVVPMRLEWGAGHERFFNRLDQILG